MVARLHREKILWYLTKNTVNQGFSTFKHVAQLITKQMVRDPPTVQLLLGDNCCTCTEQK